jgi:hypothetical protein
VRFIVGKKKKKHYLKHTQTLPQTKVHIISFDVPYPTDYGGVIDVFFKIKNLYQQGCIIYLHCFQYGRAVAPELEKYCKQVWYYPRKIGINGLSMQLPYIMYSRRDKQLLFNLLNIDAPIIFEGIHCTYLLNHPQLSGRKKIIRNHNVEHQYYQLLARRESNLIKKCYYYLESFFLKKLERKLFAADILMPISDADTAFFSTLYPLKKVVNISGFHPYDSIISQKGKSDYCLYHGNLSHPENIEAALFLIQAVFNDTTTRLIIAGRSPSSKILNACKPYSNIQLIENPDSESMAQLIADAQIHLLPTFQKSGLKLKLLYALFAGRFVLANEEMLFGTQVQDACIIANTAEEFKQKILLLMTAEFDEKEIEKRKAILSKAYNNKINSKRIMDILQE